MQVDKKGRGKLNSNSEPINIPSVYKGTAYGWEYEWSQALLGDSPSGTCIEW